MRKILPAAMLVWIVSAAPAWAQWERGIHENSPYFPNSYVHQPYAEPDFRNGNWSPPRWGGPGPASGMFYGYGYNPSYYTGGYPVGSGNYNSYQNGNYQGMSSSQFPNSGYSGYVPYGDKRGSIAYGWR